LKFSWVHIFLGHPVILVCVDEGLQETGDGAILCSKFQRGSCQLLSRPFQPFSPGAAHCFSAPSSALKSGLGARHFLLQILHN